MLRLYLNPHVDLELTGEIARAYAAADEPGRPEMANRLLAKHIELAGSGEAGVAAGSEIPCTTSSARLAPRRVSLGKRFPAGSGTPPAGCWLSAVKAPSGRPRSPNRALHTADMQDLGRCTLLVEAYGPRREGAARPRPQGRT